jgi:rubredoxin
MNVKMRSLMHPVYFLPNLRDMMKSYMCVICGFVYEEEMGRPEDGIPPGTSWEDVPENWKCPDCGAAKSDFEMIEI